MARTSVMEHCSGDTLIHWLVGMSLDGCWEQISSTGGLTGQGEEGASEVTGVRGHNVK